MARPRRIVVVWYDTTTHRAGYSRHEAEQLTTTERHTSGFLVNEEADVIRVAQTYDPADDTFDDVTVIPAPWVRSRKRRK